MSPPKPSIQSESPFFFSVRHTETGKVASSVDWTKSNLGPPESWPSELKTTLGMMFGNLHAVSLFWGPEKNYFYNDAYIPIVGRSKHPQAMGQRGEVVWAEIWEFLVPQIDHVMKEGGATWNVDQYLPILGDDGLPRDAYFTYSYSPVFLADGEVGGTLVTCTETTEKVLAEKKIRGAHETAEQSRKLLHEFFMQSPVPMVILSGPEYHFTLANPPYEKLIGRQCMGKNLFDVYSEEEVKDYLPLLENVFKTGEPYVGKEQPFSIEEKGRLNTLWLDFGYHPFRDDHGNIQGILAVVVDVTKQRADRLRVEDEKQKFESIFVESPSAMALLRGPDFVYEKVNPNFQKLLGSREVIGKPLEASVPELGPVHGIMTEVYSSGTSFMATEVETFTNLGEGDARRMFLDYNCTRVEDGKGNPYGVYIHISDVTTKVEARQKILAAIRMRDEFISIASHELKTPLTSLKLELQLLRRGVNPEQGLLPSPERLAKKLDTSTRQIDRLARLVDDLLDVTRLESGKVDYQFQETDLSSLVQEVADRFPEYSLEEKRKVHLKLDPQVMVKCDQFRMEQVVTNLISNAIKYGEGKPVDVSVRHRRGHAEVEVKDHGKGISPEEQGKVFERFERVGSAKGISGLGLGLFISKRIVDAHGGTIHLRSSVGDGSTFTIRL